MTDHSLQAAPADVGGPVSTDAGTGIVQVCLYRDAGGRVIEALIPVGQVFVVPKFRANVTVMVNTPMGPQPIPIEIDIDAATVPEAFAVMDVQVKAKAEEAVKAKIDQMQKIARRQQLASAGKVAIP